jgi:predicted RNase H-like HicB family nuclease
MRKYLVVIEKTSTGFSAYVPDLPGCVATGKTRPLTERLIYEAIEFHIEGLKEMKKRIPEGNTEAMSVLMEV